MPAKSLRVAVVDNNQDIANSLAALLRLDGYQVAVAYDARAGWRLACDWSPDVMILDIAMPEKNGYQLAQEIRQHPACQNVHLIALTGLWGDLDRQEGLKAGFDDYFVKPVLPSVLLQRLADLQRRKDGAAQPDHETD
jgi:DNA-binding response OmpR family regulator